MLSSILTLLSSDLPRAFAFTLLHTLWQGATIAALLALTFRLLPANRVNARYAVAGLALASILLAAIVTWSVLRLAGAVGLAGGDASPPTDVVGLPASGGDAAGMSNASVARVGHGHRLQSNAAGSSVAERRETRDSSSSVGITGKSADAIEASSGSGVAAAIPWTTWLTLGWLAGMVCMLLRVVLAIAATPRLLADAAGDCSAIDRLQSLVDDLCRQFRIRFRVRVVACSQVHTPAVFGVFWQVLLVPPALLTGMPVEHWRILFTHELAHVRRYDFLVNLLQMVIEAVLFFNPAVWWISRQMRIEREACCDAWAVKLSGQRRHNRSRSRRNAGSFSV